MSSILDALRKVESEERRRPIRLPPAQPRPRKRLAALVAAAAFVAGAGVVALVVGLRGTPPEPVKEAHTEVASAAPEAAALPSPPAAAPAAGSASAPPAPAAAAPVPPAPVAPTPVPSAPAAVGPAVEPPPAEGADEAVSDDADEDSDVPDQITILRPSREPAPEPEVQAEVQVEALPVPAPAEPPIDVLPGPPAGAPEIHVSFLIYSAAPERRQVSLTIDNGPLVTLHEGQKSGGISLVRILRDRIHVEQGGRTFSVRAVL